MAKKKMAAIPAKTIRVTTYADLRPSIEKRGATVGLPNRAFRVAGQAFRGTHDPFTAKSDFQKFARYVVGLAALDPIGTKFKESLSYPSRRRAERRNTNPR